MDDNPRSVSFQFDRFELEIFDRKVFESTLSGKPKVYTYFLIDEEVAGARSTGAGLVLLRKQ
jgi:hypothetical protein